MFAVEFRHVSRRYGGTDVALFDVNFNIEAGSFFGILAPEGSGKTSLVRMIFDYIRPSSGNIRVFERRSIRDSVKVRRSADFVPARIPGRSHMSIQKMLEMLHASYGTVNQERLQELCDLFNLHPHSSFNSLDASARKRLAIVSAILNDPPMIVLDEPSLDLDDHMRTRTFQELKRLHDNGSTIIFTTISVEEVRTYSTDVAVLHNGILLNACPTMDMPALRAQRITLESPEAAEAVQALGIDHFQENDPTQGENQIVSFLYAGDTDVLVKTLARHPVVSLKIKEPTLDSVLVANHVLKKETMQSDAAETEPSDMAEAPQSDVEETIRTTVEAIMQTDNAEAAETTATETAPSDTAEAPQSDVEETIRATVEAIMQTDNAEAAESAVAEEVQPEAEEMTQHETEK